MTRHLLVATGFLVLALIGVWVGWTALRPAPHHKTGLRPLEALRIVGSTTCRNCHATIADRYDTSGHAHTFALTADSAVAKQLAGREFRDPQRQQYFRYHFDQNGLSALLPDVFGEERFPLTYALGSGTHAVSFLTLLPRSDGATVGLEHRVSYYHDLLGLGLTVGHPLVTAAVEDSEHFGKIVDERKLAQCIGCHTTQARIEDHQLLDVIPHVGCESCHGPGSQHVAVQHAGRTDAEFSVATRWPTALDELQTCGRCHRMPESLKASELVRTSPVLPRFQPAGMMQSRCYIESNGALRCTTCHDPHAKVSTEHHHYERVCLNCHQQQRVTQCPQGSDSCISCHMPAIRFEGVASFHDHWIRVRTADDPAAASSSPADATD